MNHKSRLCLIGLIVTALICAVPGAATTRNVSARHTSTDYSQYVGKYPSEMFKKEPGLKTKLRTLLGTSYKAFFDRLQTEMPIEKDGDAIVARGCAAHECTVEEAILVIQNDTPYVALRINSKFSKTFPADRSKLPDALKRAMEQ
ncbi:MAG TPA: hypothetical protein VHQ95_12505 [Pyrinomonadaceae bacterium]|jgi:hypothetical protein|nr:hypothetical protein [Pyrinomonadaceae bacterium]